MFIISWDFVQLGKDRLNFVKQYLIFCKLNDTLVNLVFLNGRLGKQNRRGFKVVKRGQKMRRHLYDVVY